MARTIWEAIEIIKGRLVCIKIGLFNPHHQISIAEYETISEHFTVVKRSRDL